MSKILFPIKYLIGMIIRLFNLKINIEGFKIIFPKEMNIDELGGVVFGGYEKAERVLVKKYVRSDDAILEMGACLGVVSLTINRILQDKSKQVSVEPNPHMHKYLVQNKLINNGEFHIETCIVSKKKNVDFFMGGSAFLSSNTLGRGKKVIVEGKTLKELRDQYFDFTVIVMDIEGGELNFLRSFNLEETNVRLIVWETHLSPNMLSVDELNECYTLLKKQGFTLKEEFNHVEAWTKEV